VVHVGAYITIRRLSMPSINRDNLTQLIGKHNMIRLETLQKLEPAKYNKLIKRFNLHQVKNEWYGYEQRVSNVKAFIRELRKLY